MQAFTHVRALAAPLEGRNVDTDQIIPARFLKKNRDEFYKNYLFHDLRFDEHGVPRPEFILNRPPFQGAQILVADENFGCGSSREGAVYCLADYGIRAILAPSFGDIFFNNCLKNGLLPVRLDAKVLAAIRQPDEQENFAIVHEEIQLWISRRR
jgi:3-isopropylmalate/(R)-2-methylmalate dehydratase small subunit